MKVDPRPPCDGCGYCCSVALCALAQGYHGVEARPPCPSLLLEYGRYWCGILDVMNRRAHGDEEDGAAASVAMLITQALGIGKGCDIPHEKAAYELGRQIKRLDDGERLGPYEHAACAACRKCGKATCDCSMGDKRPCVNNVACGAQAACENEAEGWAKGCPIYCPQEDGS